MDIIEGCFYHISDKFFLEVNEPSLMANKEDGNYRPHYLAIRDTLNTEIFWMIPVSSKYTKFAALYDKQIKSMDFVQKDKIDVIIYLNRLNNYRKRQIIY